MASVVFVPLLIVLTLSVTKLWWYKNSLLPFIALVVAYFLIRVAHVLGEHVTGSRKLIAVLFLGSLFAYPMGSTLHRVMNPKVYVIMPKEQYRFRQFIRSDAVLPPYSIMVDGYNPTARWEVEMRRAQGMNVELAYSRGEPFPEGRKVGATPTPLAAGDRTVVCTQQSVSYVEANYQVQELFARDSCRLLSVNGPRQ